jgi:prepilin peptidase CpaA
LTAAFVSHVILVATAALAFYAAFTDLTRFAIPNGLIASLVAIYVVHTFTLENRSELLWDVAFALMIFLVLLFFYARDWVGGGDVKLLTVSLLWTGIHCALVFSVILLVAATAHTVAVKFKRSDHHDDDKSVRIAFAPSIAVALVGVLMLGCAK